MRLKGYFVHIMTNARHTVLYTGVTNDLRRRVWEHQHGTGSALTRRYNNKLVYFEIGLDAREAIEREKLIKGGSRQKKLDLVNKVNPDWRDLSGDLLSLKWPRCRRPGLVCEEIASPFRGLQ